MAFRYSGKRLLDQCKVIFFRYCTKRKLVTHKNEHQSKYSWRQMYQSKCVPNSNYNIGIAGTPSSKWSISITMPGLIALALFQASEQQEQQELLAEVDVLHNGGQEAEAYQKLRAAAERRWAESSAEFHWRLARGARAMANSPAASDQQRRQLTYEAFAAAERGLQIDPDSAGCHKWMGILLDLTGRYEGTKQRIRNSFLVKEHFCRAAEAKPDDAVVLHCLGAWCFEVADLPWYQRQLAAAFFAAPPTSSYDEALQYLLRAEQVEPNFYSCNLLYIGKAYLRKGDSRRAREFLQRAANYQGDSHDDRKSKQEASELLKQC